MFSEQPRSDTVRRGWIEVISGSMFSGKTEELIRRLKRARIAKMNVEIFKPKLDNRYDEVKVVSHDANYIQSIPVDSASQILSMTNHAEVVGIDEAQFFDMELPSVCETLANRGVRVIIAGLDKDYLAKPFGPMPVLFSIAEYVTKVHAICMKCGNLANYSYRTVSNNTQIMIGEQESYIPLCRYCFNEERSMK